MYLEGSDQHRGWFQSSLLESCGTRGCAPYDVVLTHGFTLDEDGRKMSKSLGNGVVPQDVIKQSGADILRLWVCPTDYADDQRIGPEILKTTIETYRKLRNTMRWMLGALAHFRDEDKVAPAKMPELERLMLHRLAELDALVRKDYADFDYKRIVAALSHVHDRRSLGLLFRHPQGRALLRSDLVADAARLPDGDRPAVPLHRRPGSRRCCRSPPRKPGWRASRRTTGSVHLEPFPQVPPSWRNDALAEKWRKVRAVRRVVTGALEIERAQKRIGSSLEAAPDGLCRPTSTCSPRWSTSTSPRSRSPRPPTLVEGEGPADAFRLDDVKGVAVEVRLAEGRKCARSWKILPSVGSDPHYPDVSPRDAQALREWDAHAAGGGMTAMLWGPLTRIGLAVAVATAVLDQASKLWLLFAYNLGDRGVVTLTPFLDLVLAWNTGISFSLFAQDGPAGRWIFLS